MRRVLQRFAAAFALASTGAWAQAPAASPPEAFEALWIAHSPGLSKVALSDASVILEVPNARGARAVAVDERHERVWAYTPGMLRAYDFAGRALFAVAVATSGDDDDDDGDDDREDTAGRVALAANGSDGTIWLGVQTRLFHFGPSGQLLGSLQLEKPLRALSLDPARSRLWMGTRDAVTILDAGSGQQLVLLPLGRRPKVRDVSVDGSTGEAWVALERRLARYDATGRLVLATPVLELEHVSSAAHGAVWAAADRRLLRIDSAGAVTLDLKPLERRNKVLHLAANASDGSVWVAGDRDLVHVSAAGDRLGAAAFSARRKVRDLALSLDVVAPSIQIVAPSEGTALNTNRPTIRVELSDIGSGIAAETLAFEESGGALGVDCVHAEGAANCTPLSPLFEGPQTLLATVRDLAGNLSGPARLSFTVDTLAPGIALRSPQDGAVTDQPNQTFAGSLSELATLTLNGAAVPIASDLSFSMGVVLPDGRSEFALEARDAAGNSRQATVSLTLIREASAPRFSLPAGDYEVAQPVVVTAETPGAVIHFTSDGADPTEADTVVPSGGTLLVDHDLALKARAYAPGFLPSAVTAARYSVGLTKTVKPVAWTHLVNAVPGSIVKVAGGAGWNAGGVSADAFFSVDGFVEFRAGATTSQRMIGLANGDTDQGFADIEYGFGLFSGTLQVYESGVIRGEFGGYAPGDLLRVGVESGIVTYRRNGDLLYRSGVPPSYPLLVDTSLFTVGDVISEIVIAGALEPSQVATPAFSPPAGTYGTPQSVALSTATSGATVRYTTDGSDPTPGSLLYDGPIAVGAPATIKARAFKQGYFESDVASAVYAFKVATPAIDPGGGTYSNAQSVVLRCATSDATIRYTTDGSEPTQASAIYYSPIDVATATTIKAKAYLAGWTDGDSATAVYAFNYGTLATPSAEPGAGTYSTPQTVALSGPSGAALYYTTDGSEPTQASSLYSSPVTISAPTTLKAKAFQVDWTPSATVTAVYVFKVATPSMAPPGGTYSGAQNVTLSTATPGAEIRYSTDSSEPTAASALYTAPIAVSATTTLKAKAFRPSWQDSDTASAAYTITPPGAVAAGGFHSLALRPDGTVWAWGLNFSGQLGVGSGPSSSNVPIPVSGLSDLVAISAGLDFSLALKSDGTVWAWGDNTYGQVGGAAPGIYFTPVQVGALAGIVSIAAGKEHALALDTNGRVWAWGRNDSGQVGDGTYVDRFAPAIVSGLGPATALAAGSAHSLALLDDGRVASWGANFAGQLGDGTGVSTTSPVIAASLTGVSRIAAGGYHSLTITADGKAWAWGSNVVAAVGDGTTTKRLSPVEVVARDCSDCPSSFLSSGAAIAGGSGHSVAARADGSVWTWGQNSAGQLGREIPPSGAGEGEYCDEGFFGPLCDGKAAVVPGLSGIVQVSAGANHVLALAADGSIWAWGMNFDGQLGDWTNDVRYSPVAIGTATSWLTAAPVLSHGSGLHGEPLSVTATSPTPGATVRFTTDGQDPAEADADAAGGIAVPGPMTVKARAWAEGYAPSVVTAATYTFAASTPTVFPPSGTYARPLFVSLHTWTPGAEIRFTTDGSEPTSGSSLYSLAIRLDEGATVRAKAFFAGWQESTTSSESYVVTGERRGLAAGSAHSLTLTKEGTVWAWGDNARGQLGNGTTGSEHTPTRVAGLTDAIAVAAGGQSSFALRDDGTVWGWGDGSRGQLGTGVADQASSPVTVAGLTDIMAIAAGDAHLLALHRNGTVLALGANAEGQLGDGTTIDRSAPVTVLGVSAIAIIAAGARHSMSATGDSWVRSWGANDRGQLGNGTLDPSPAPVDSRVFGWPIHSLAAGSSHSMATYEVDRLVEAWGASGSGQLGTGDTTDRVYPNVTLALTGVRSIAGGGQHSLAADGAGGAYSWGAGGEGQLGDGGADDRSTPQPVPGLVEIVHVAAGAGHSLALELDGTIWAWGANAAGQLGDGTLLERHSPVAVNTDGWLVVAAPTFSPGSGTYAAVLDVVMSCRTSGAAIHYTVDGHDPTESDPVIASGGLVRVDRDTTLKARAFRNGTASTIRRGDYLIRLAPVMTPDGGPFVSSVSVSITAGVGAEIRYTLDGSPPDSGSLLYGGPITVSESSTVSAIALYGVDVAGPTSRTFTSYVARPVLSPAAGVYPSGQTIQSSSTTAGATLRYTMSGADPTEADAVFPTGGIPLTAPFRLKVRGFKVGAEPSPVALADYAPLGHPDADDDGDGLTNAQEATYGTDPSVPDSNGDGLSDGAAVALGLSPTNLDMDGDGLTNAVERTRGTDPFRADTDGDGAPDGVDCSPLDSTRSACEPPDPNDQTPPVITIIEPPNAVAVPRP